MVLYTYQHAGTRIAENAIVLNVQSVADSVSHQQVKSVYTSSVAV